MEIHVFSGIRRGADEVMLHQKRHEDKYSCLLLWNTEIKGKTDSAINVDGAGPYLVVTSPPLHRTFMHFNVRSNDVFIQSDGFAIYANISRKKEVLCSAGCFLGNNSALWSHYE